MDPSTALLIVEFPIFAAKLVANLRFSAGSSEQCTSVARVLSCGKSAFQRSTHVPCAATAPSVSAGSSGSYFAHGTSAAHYALPAFVGSAPARATQVVGKEFRNRKFAFVDK